VTIKVQTSAKTAAKLHKPVLAGKTDGARNNRNDHPALRPMDTHHRKSSSTAPRQQSKCIINLGPIWGISEATTGGTAQQMKTAD